MRRILTMVFAALAAMFSGVEASAQELPFADGEKIQYTVHYKYGISADLASVTGTVSAEGGNFRVGLDLNSFKFWDSFYKMRDHYESTFRPSEGVLPVKAMRDVSEGAYWAKCFYDWGSNPKAVHCVLDKKNKPHRDTVLTDSREIRDIVNLIYYFRTLDFDALEKGGHAKATMAMDRTLYSVTLRVVGRERKKVSGQWWNTIKLAFAVKAVGVDADESNTSVSVADSEAGGEKVFFWITDDPNRVPVFFSAGIKVGAVQGRLTSLEGTKYPLTSKE